MTTPTTPLTTAEHSRRLSCAREAAINDASDLATLTGKTTWLYQRGHQYLTTHTKMTTLYGTLIAHIEPVTEAHSL